MGDDQVETFKHKCTDLYEWMLPMHTGNRNTLHGKVPKQKEDLMVHTIVNRFHKKKGIS